MIDLIQTTFINAAIGSTGATVFLFIYYFIRMKMGV